MKQKDLILIVVVGFISVIFSLLLTNFVIKPSKHDLQAPKVDPISDSFKEPDKTYFNERSLDPTRLIQIGDGSNTDPFAGGQ